MKTRHLSAAALAVAVAATTFSMSVIADNNLSNKEKAIAVLESIETGDPTPIGYINPEKYIQHNPMVGDGLAGFGEVMQALPAGSAKASVKRAFEDGDFVFTHTEYNFFGPKIGFDVFRFEDGLIVEHWDNLQETATETVSGRSQIDGPTRSSDLEKTSQNKELIAGFVDDVLMGANPGKITDYVSTETYMQHNPAVGDGLQALGEALQQMAEAGMPLTYTKNHAILGEGDFVLAISEGEFLGKTSSFYDLFRIEEGKIVEHWDTIETLIPEADAKNRNGKFRGLSASKGLDGVIEIATFMLKDGVTPAEFRPLDTAVENQHVSRQPGFIKRESAAGDNGEWLVVVHWHSLEDAEASMASFADAPAAAEFMSKLDPETMVMKRYSK